MTPLKAIRFKCLDCCGGQANEVRLCSCVDCTLYPFRMGKNPALAGKGNISNLRPKNPTHVADPDNEANSEGDDTPGGFPRKKATCAALFTGRMTPESRYHQEIEIRGEN